MNWLKILILILFLFCCGGAGHTGPFAGLVEWYLITHLAENSIIENLILLAIVGLQVAGIISIIKSYHGLMVFIALILGLRACIGLLATIGDKFATSSYLAIVIGVNGSFLIVIGLYIVKYLQRKKEFRGEMIENAVTNN